MEALFLERWKAYLRYLDFPGKDPARVYLAGLGLASSATYPRTVMEPVLGGHRSLLVDWLGCGFSDCPEDFSYSLEDHTTTVAILLDQLELKECSVIGHSMGGAVAITLAAMRPDLVSRLLVAEGNLDPGGGNLSRGIAAQSEEEFIGSGCHTLLRNVREEGMAGDRISAIVVGIWQIAAPHALYRSAVSLVQGTQPTMRERFLKMTIPRAYIFGEQNLPDPDADLLAEQGVQVLIVPNAGHAMMVDNPAGFSDVLQAALIS